MTRCRKIGCPAQLLVLLLGSILLSSCRTTESESDTIRIGVIASRTGIMADTSGISTIQAAQLAAQHINDAGGIEIDGVSYPIELFIADDESTGEGGITAAHQLINQDRVVALVGASLSRVAIRVSELAQERRVPFITTIASNPAITADKDYVFRMIFTDTFQGQALAHFALSDMGIGTAAVLYDTADAYSQGLAESFRDHFTLIGGRVVAFERYTTDVRQWDEQLSRIRTSSARLLLLPNSETVVPEQAAQARAIGIDVLLLGGDSWEWVAPEQRAPLEGGFFTAAYTLESGTPKNKRFIADYQAAYGTMPDAAAAHTYDAFGLLVMAMERSQRKDPRGIQLGLAEIHRYDGVTGSLHYNENGDPQKNAVLLQIQDGEVVFVKMVSPFAELEEP